MLKYFNAHSKEGNEYFILKPEFFQVNLYIIQIKHEAMKSDSGGTHL